MLKRFLIILSVLAAAGTSVFYADMFKRLSSEVTDIAAHRPNVEDEIDAMLAGVEETEPLATDVPIQRMAAESSRPKWLTPFSKTLTVGREPIARVSTDWTDVRSEYHAKGRATESARVPANEEEGRSARNPSKTRRQTR